jgi:hypothetical protein
MGNSPELSVEQTKSMLIAYFIYVFTMDVIIINITKSKSPVYEKIFPLDSTWNINRNHVNQKHYGSIIMNN